MQRSSSRHSFRAAPAAVCPPLQRWGLAWVLAMGVLLSPAASPGQQAEAESAPTAPEPEAPAPAPPSDVEVIRIKGRGVQAIETDVPDSVTQFDAATIEALGAQNVGDLAKVTPNLEIKSQGATTPTFFIRGVGLNDFNANAAGAVAVYQDDVALNAPALQLGQLFDVANVEVLRGPQGGGSGRNASAGAIKIYSRKPTGIYEANLRSAFSFSPYTQMDYEGSIEVPLVDEMLSTRLAFRFLTRDDWGSNRCDVTQFSGQAQSVGIVGDPVPPLSERLADPAKFNKVSFCGEDTPLNVLIPGTGQNRQLSALPSGLAPDINGQGNWAARGQLRFQPPNADMDWLLNLHGGKLDQPAVLGQVVGTRPGYAGEDRFNYVDQDIGTINEPGSEVFDTFQALLVENPCVGTPRQVRQCFTQTANNARKVVGHRLVKRLDRDRYAGEYNNIGDEKQDTFGTFLRGDMSFGPVNLTSISAYDQYLRQREIDTDFSPNVLSEQQGTDEGWQFSQELRLGGELADAPFQWSAGGYYLMESLDTQREFPSDFNGDLFQDYTQELFSFAFYAGFVWDFLDDFTLDGGVRYNWEQKTFDIVVSQEVAPSPDFPNGLRSNPGSENVTWQAPTGTISLTYRFTEDVSTYWKYSRGWKGGHISAGTLAGFRVTSPADPEEIDAFETGLRGNWWDGRIGLGTSLFWYSYRDYQVFLTVNNEGSPPITNVVNASDAQVYGAEADLRVEPLDGLVVTGRFAWLESEFLDFTNPEIRTVISGDCSVGCDVETFEFIRDFSGNPLPNSPRFTFSGSIEYTFDMGRWGALIPRWDFAWSDISFFDPSGGVGSLNNDGTPQFSEETIAQPEFWLHNLRLAYRTPEGNIEVAGFVRNFTNVSYRTLAVDSSPFLEQIRYWPGEPRVWGMSISFHW